MGHNTAGSFSSGAHWKQFIAERGIEYGLQFVTPFFLNSLNCLYLKKSCKFLQSYEKTHQLRILKTHKLINLETQKLKICFPE